MAERATKSGIALEAQQKIHSKYDPQLAGQILRWVEQAGNFDGFPTGNTVEADEFIELFRDGQRLCQLANALEPNAIKKVNTSALAFKKMENISFFLSFAEKHINKTELFQTVDLFEGQDPNAVLVCLSALARKGDKFGKDAIGPKESQGEKRNWTDEQLRAGDSIIGLQMGSNKGANASGLILGNRRHM
ncbi:hypothetical protein FO519_005484 [Halicephalobus sp. NKZ332]|nr:hypothetical protein FO519_005484 [Halicephalobus sp. NKZ332]